MDRDSAGPTGGVEVGQFIRERPAHIAGNARIDGLPYSPQSLAEAMMRA